MVNEAYELLGVINKYFRRFVLSENQIHFFRRKKNKLKSYLFFNPDHKYLFILSPQYCGSTLLTQIICTSKFVSVNNTLRSREGQNLPSVQKIMRKHDRRWDTTLDFDWEFIKKEWLKHWDLTVPVLLEKSPPNVIRAKSIQKAFKPSFFIILYRNPYAHCESLIRRNKWQPTKAAAFSIQCLKYQKTNIEFLQESISFSYDMLTSNPEDVIKRIESLLPELSDIKINRQFTAHNLLGEKKMKITNLDETKINNLSEQQLNEINKVFRDELNILGYFNISLNE